VFSNRSFGKSKEIEEIGTLPFIGFPCLPWDYRPAWHTTFAEFIDDLNAFSDAGCSSISF
jgi:hypothetical protein